MAYTYYTVTKQDETAIVEAMVVFSSILQPAGPVARQELDLIITAMLLMLIVVIPVFILTAFISWRYREGNSKAAYRPDWDHSRLAESIWWGFPLVIILILSVITWDSTHKLDQFRPLAAQSKPLKIQVVALEWKWLFIYPEQNIATVNTLHFPEKTPLDFEITADAPMNSFWIPRLGGQIYAMAGMSTRLHLMADQPGNYRGSSANLSGRGFAGMNFTATAESEHDFKKWVNTAKQSPETLNNEAYSKLLAPSVNNKPSHYSSASANLYHKILSKYTPHSHRLAPAQEGYNGL